MVNIVAVSRDRHAGKGWRRPSGYAFTASDSMVGLVGAEFAKTAVVMPIAFIEQSGRYVPVGVMSPVQGRNLFAAPNGQWLGSYVPVGLRTYPFHLARIGSSGKITLCIDEDSGWVVDADTNVDATRFFEDDGSPSAAVKATMEFLQKVELNRSHTDLAVADLAEAGLIQRWPFAVTIGKDRVTVDNLHRIDEAALNVLDKETFLKLRKSSALLIAYAQLISTQMVGVLEQMAVLQQRLLQKTQSLPPISSLFAIDDSGTIKFS